MSRPQHLGVPNTAEGIRRINQEQEVYDRDPEGYERQKEEHRKAKFEYEYIEKLEEVRKHIQYCEGQHMQQVAYSTFHDALTQICFGCLKIRSNIIK